MDSDRGDRPADHPESERCGFPDPVLEREHEWRRDVKPQDLPHPSLEYGRDDAKLERLGPTFELEGENLALGGPVAGTPEPLRVPEVLSDLPRGSAEGWKLAADADQRDRAPA